ncbi:hypothetical protein IWX91DRAFT_353056 [Phyllosticta citricarpa]
MMAALLGSGLVWAGLISLSCAVLLLFPLPAVVQRHLVCTGSATARYLPAVGWQEYGGCSCSVEDLLFPFA